MKRIIFLFSCLLIASSVFAQIHLGIFGGLAAYNGDLTTSILPKKVTNGSIGITGNYEFSEQIMIRAGFTYAVVGGADRYSNKDDLVRRNLSFETRLFEFSAIGEYYLNNLYERKYSPYFFAGLALFLYDPYAYDLNKNQIFLRPLSTEGQGIAGYSNKKSYSTSGIAIPFGAGFKYAINENFRVGLEIGIRKLFTDYLDDVSKTYVDPVDLFNARGQTAVDISYRGDELPGGATAYPVKGEQRGSLKHKDSYYFAGIHLTYLLSGGAGGGGIFHGGGKHKSRNGCPANPM